MIEFTKCQVPENLKFHKNLEIKGIGIHDGKLWICNEFTFLWFGLNDILDYENIDISIDIENTPKVKDLLNGFQLWQSEGLKTSRTYALDTKFRKDFNYRDRLKLDEFEVKATLNFEHLDFNELFRGLKTMEKVSKNSTAFVRDNCIVKSNWYKDPEFEFTDPIKIDGELPNLGIPHEAFESLQYQPKILEFVERKVNKDTTIQAFRAPNKSIFCVKSI